MASKIEASAASTAEDARRKPPKSAVCQSMFAALIRRERQMSILKKQISTFRKPANIKKFGPAAAKLENLLLQIRGDYKYVTLSQLPTIGEPNIFVEDDFLKVRYFNDFCTLNTPFLF